MQLLEEFAKSHGYDFSITALDGKFQSAKTTTGQKVWYIGSDLGNGLVTFTFGDFREPDKKFTTSSKAVLDKADQAQLKRFTKNQAAEKLRREFFCSQLLADLWNDWSARDLPGTNVYLDKKNLPKASGVLLNKNETDNQRILKIPMRDESDVLWNVQTVFEGVDIKRCGPALGGRA